MLRGSDYQKKPVQAPKQKPPAAVGKPPALDRALKSRCSPPRHRRHSHSPPRPPGVNAHRFEDGICVTGGTTTDTIHVKGISNLDGDVVVGGDMDVTGDITSNGGLCIPNEICVTLDGTNKTYTVPSDIYTLRTLFNVTRTPKTSTSVALPFADGPLVPNPLPYGTPVPVSTGLLTLTPQTKGPWYFLDLPNDPTKKASADTAGTRVLFCGIPEPFIPNPGAGGGSNPPLDNTNSIATLANTSSNVLDFTLLVRSSSEPAYDFVYVVKNGIRIYSASGAGPSATEPYVTGTLQVRLLPGDTLTFQFSKDPAAYAGLDNVYFYLQNLVASVPASLPSRVIVTRGTSIVINYAWVIDFDSIGTYLLTKGFQFKAGDVISLEFDANSYTSFTVVYTSLL